MKQYFLFLLTMSVMAAAYPQQAEVITHTDCDTMDLVDWFRKWLHISKPEKEKKNALFLAPVFGSTPSTGFIVGATIQSAFRLTGSNMSAAQANVQYTTKGQILIFLRNTIFAKENKLLFSGDWRYFSYTEPTYGLGTNAPIGTLPYYFHFNGEGEATDSLTQPMQYNYFKFHQVVSFRVGRALYAGAGFHLDAFAKIDDQRLDTLYYVTSHYAYSRKYDYDPERYKQVGVSVNLVYDTRDNQVNAYKGMYANLNYRVNPTFLGSDHGSSSLWSEFRFFKGLSKRDARVVLGCWLIGNFTVTGDPPYLALPAIGYDQRTKSGRGYSTGRYRGQNMLYGETEFRFPISKCTKTLSGVVFLNAVTTDNRDAQVKLFDYLQPGYGVGIRILFNKETRMNMQVDYGMGNQSSGIYFGASEVF